MEGDILFCVRDYYNQSLNEASPELKSFFIIHIPLVVDKAKNLAKKRGADVEIVELAALLHDIASIQGDDEGHDVKGAEIAGDLLKKLNYPVEKATRVIDAILNHRGSKQREVRTKEAQILIDADALSHFEMIDKLKETFFPTNKSILAKLTRSFNKMSVESQKEIQSKFDEIKKELKELEDN